MIGTGGPNCQLSEEQVGELLRQAFASRMLNGKARAVIIPDSTRTAPIPLLFRQLYQVLSAKVSVLDYLVALGTHPHMSAEALRRLVGVTAEELAARYKKVNLFNHRWDLAETWETVGEISVEETGELSGGTPLGQRTRAHQP